ncbi:acylamino-acid-releasing enzyme-like [Brevipalpus obovatus]|uniref:acylamino-acid-releasing enzyme-like n=1 Tax=Brevipalpus obovatus TaxID=246614 RepID=UPI003D9EDE5C
MSSSKLISLLKSVKKPSESQAVIEEVKQLVRRYCLIPSPTKAEITSSHDGEFRFRVDYSHPDLDNLEEFCFTKYYIAKLGQNGISSVSSGCDEPVDTSAELASTVSRDGQMKAVIRKVAGDGGKNKELVEICSRRSKIKSINGAKDKIHGKIHLFANFGVLKWSPDNRYLMYVAEKYQETSGYFAPKGKDGEEVKGQGDEFLYREEFGEQMVGLSHSCICVIDTKNDYKVRVIEKENYSLCEGFFFDSNTIGFVGLKETPFRLGLVYCPIRESCLFKLDLDNSESQPTTIYGEDQGLALRSPRPSSSGQVVFLQNPARGPHFQASDLVLYDVNSKKSQILLKSSNKIPEDIHNPERIEDLFALSLPKNVWSQDGRRIVLRADIGVRSHVFVIDIKSGSMKRIPLKGEVNCILDYFKDILLVNELSPISGPNIKVGMLTESCSVEGFLPIDPDMYNHHKEMFYEYETISAAELDKESENHRLSTILLGRKEDFGKPTPTIVRPHGGPHSCNLATYFPSLLIYAELGFKILFVNYRGSNGMNREHLEYLCGKVGRSDVADLVHAIKFYVETGEIDDQHISLFGSSHGGFLVTHLIGQCDDFRFNSCTAVNPVTDLSSMIFVTDIPDWNLVEGLGYIDSGFPFESIHDSKVLAKLKECSPIMYIDRVKTPTLVVLGTIDKRVPMSQGRAYYHGLKCRSVPAKCLVYEDNHSIMKIPNAIDLTMNSIMWILDHMSRSDQ